MEVAMYSETGSSPSDSSKGRVMHRRERSSDSTISAYSIFDYSIACYSTTPTSIGEIQSKECFNTGYCNEPNTRKVSSRSESSTHLLNELPEVHEKQDLTALSREDPSNQFLENAANIFLSVTENKRNSRRSIRFAEKSSATFPNQTKGKSLTSEAKDMGIKFSKAQNEKLKVEEQRAIRYSNEKFQHITESPPKIESRSLKKPENNLCVSAPLNRELKNLIDTLEFAKIDVVPIIHEIWSNGKLVTEGCPPKKNEIQGVESAPRNLDKLITSSRLNSEGKERKRWLAEGLYVGQESCSDWYEYPTENKRRKTRSFKSKKPNKTLPLPMWHGKRLIETGRDFKLPFDICSPLPPGQPKPDEWRKTTKNRFVGEAAALWKVSKFLDSSSSKCVCNPTIGCDENCQNRIMFYECDDTNCASGADKCTNRPFAALQERRKAGGKYRVGVEVIKTNDRGYGVRSTRCFEPNQIIVEYTGEIITEEECERRMREDYKNNDCHYLMSFDQSMIIDATKGSIARFINHSCKPNCRMVKWIVGGNPRLALFAGDGPIMTGDELTYDYNFDPFSTKNIQKCRCGSDNCRGVLGPRLRDLKLAKEKDDDKFSVKASTSDRKRKIKTVKENYNYLEDSIAKKRKSINGASRGVSRSSHHKRSLVSINEDVSDAILNAGNLINTDPTTKKTKKNDLFHPRAYRDQNISVSKYDAKCIGVNFDISSRGLRSLKSRKKLSNLKGRKSTQKLNAKKNNCGSKRKKQN